MGWWLKASGLKELWDWFRGDYGYDQRPPNDPEAIRRMVESGQQIRLMCGHSDVGFYGKDQNIVVLPGTVLYEPRAVRYGTRSTAGDRIRIAKGFSIYSGGSASQSESVDELRMIGYGDFIVTNGRVVFVSDLRTISMAFKEIIGTSVYDNGIRINKLKREKPYIFIFPAYSVTLGDREFTTDGPLVDMALAQAMHLSGG